MFHQVRFDYVQFKEQIPRLEWIEVQVKISDLDAWRAYSFESTRHIFILILGHRLTVNNVYQIQYVLGQKNN